MPPHEAAVQPFPLFLRPTAGVWGQPATVTREESKETGLHGSIPLTWRCRLKA